jgi:hypothetical protein
LNIKRIDEENENFYKEIASHAEHGSISVKDILGFNLEGAKVFIPRVACSDLNPSKGICPATNEVKGISNIFSLAPVYDTLIYPISPYGNRDPDFFKKVNNVSLDDFLLFVEKKHIIPYFPVPYDSYDKNFILNFLQPGLPRISCVHLDLLSLINACRVVSNDCKKCTADYKSAKEDIVKIGKRFTGEEGPESCARCLQVLYSAGIKREQFLKTATTGFSICALKDILVSRNVDAVVRTNCNIAQDALGLFTGL